MADIVIDRSDAQIKTGIEKASDLQSSASEIDGNLPLTRQDLITSIDRGYLQNWNGVFVSSDNWRTSNFIDVNEGDIVYITSTIVGSNTDILIGYDASEAFVSVLLSNSSYLNEEVIIPSGVSKVRIVSVYNNDMKLEKDVRVPLKKKVSNKTWTAIGDSITFRNGYQPLVNTSIQMKAVRNEGYSGKPLANFGGQGSIVASTIGMIESDIYTIMAGTNDFKLNVPIGTNTDYTGNTGDTTFYGAFRVMIDRCYTLNADCEILLFNILRRDNDSYDSYSTNTAGHTVSDYNEAIKWVAEREALKHLDLFNESGITDRNLATYTDDGLHPTPLGYELISKVMINKMLFLTI